MARRSAAGIFGRAARFRALAHLDPSGVRLVSRNGNRFASFTDLCASLEMFLRAKHAVLDGEIVCLDEDRHSQFNELLFRRGTPRFCAFDLLWLNGRDLRELPLVERKRSLRRLIPAGCDSVLYVDHIEGEGERLFEVVCERDLEGIVAGAPTASLEALLGKRGPRGTETPEADPGHHPCSRASWRKRVPSLSQPRKQPHVSKTVRRFRSRNLMIFPAFSDLTPTSSRAA